MLVCCVYRGCRFCPKLFCPKTLSDVTRYVVFICCWLCFGCCCSLCYCKFCRRVQDNDYKKGLEADRRRNEAQQEERRAKVTNNNTSLIAALFTFSARILSMYYTVITSHLSYEHKHFVCFNSRQDSGARHVSLLRAESHHCRISCCSLVALLMLLCLAPSPSPPPSLCVGVCQEREAENALAIAQEEAANLAREEQVSCGEQPKTAAFKGLARWPVQPVASYLCAANVVRGVELQQQE